MASEASRRAAGRSASLANVKLGGTATATPTFASAVTTAGDSRTVLEAWKARCARLTEEVDRLTKAHQAATEQADEAKGEAGWLKAEFGAAMATLSQRLAAATADVAQRDDELTALRQQVQVERERATDAAEAVASMRAQVMAQGSRLGAGLTRLAHVVEGSRTARLRAAWKAWCMHVMHGACATASLAVAVDAGGSEGDTATPPHPTTPVAAFLALRDAVRSTAAQRDDAIAAAATAAARVSVLEERVESLQRQVEEQRKEVDTTAAAAATWQTRWQESQAALEATSTAAATSAARSGAGVAEVDGAERRCADLHAQVTALHARVASCEAEAASLRRVAESHAACAAAAEAQLAEEQRRRGHVQSVLKRLRLLQPALVDATVASTPLPPPPALAVPASGVSSHELAAEIGVPVASPSPATPSSMPAPSSPTPPNPSTYSATASLTRGVTLLRARLAAVEGELSEAAGRESRLRSERSTLVAEGEEARSRLAAAETVIAQARYDASKLEMTVSMLTAQCDAKEGALTTLRSQVAAAQREAHAYLDALHQERGRVTVLMAQVDAVGHQVQRCRADNAEQVRLRQEAEGAARHLRTRLAAALDAAEVAARRHDEEMAAVQARAAAAGEEAMALRAQLEEVQASMAQVQAERDVAVARATGAEAAVAKAESWHAEAQALLAAEREAAAASKTAAASACASETAALMRQVADLTAERDELRSQVEDYQHGMGQVADLKASLTACVEQLSRSRALIQQMGSDNAMQAESLNTARARVTWLEEECDRLKTDSAAQHTRLQHELAATSTSLHAMERKMRLVEDQFIALAAHVAAGTAGEDGGATMPLPPPPPASHISALLSLARRLWAAACASRGVGGEVTERDAAATADMHEPDDSPPGTPATRPMPGGAALTQPSCRATPGPRPDAEGGLVDAVDDEATTNGATSDAPCGQESGGVGGEVGVSMGRGMQLPTPSLPATRTGNVMYMPLAGSPSASSSASPLPNAPRTPPDLGGAHATPTLHLTASQVEGYEATIAQQAALVAVLRDTLEAARADCEGAKAALAQCEAENKDNGDTSLALAAGLEEMKDRVAAMASQLVRQQHRVAMARQWSQAVATLLAHTLLKTMPPGATPATEGEGAPAADVQCWHVDMPINTVHELVRLLQGMLAMSTTATPAPGSQGSRTPSTPPSKELARDGGPPEAASASPQSSAAEGVDVVRMKLMELSDVCARMRGVAGLALLHDEDGDGQDGGGDDGGGSGARPRRVSQRRAMNATVTELAIQLDAAERELVARQSDIDTLNHVVASNTVFHRHVVAECTRLTELVVERGQEVSDLHRRLRQLEDAIGLRDVELAHLVTLLQHRGAPQEDGAGRPPLGTPGWSASQMYVQRHVSRFCVASEEGGSEVGEEGEREASSHVSNGHVTAAEAAGHVHDGSVDEEEEQEGGVAVPVQLPPRAPTPPHRPVHDLNLSADAPAFHADGVDADGAPLVQEELDRTLSTARDVAAKQTLLARLEGEDDPIPATETIVAAAAAAVADREDDTVDPATGVDMLQRLLQRFEEAGPRPREMVHKVASNEEFRAVLASKPVVLVDFFAEWCGPCVGIAPYLEELAKEFAGVTFIKVDVDELEDLSGECGVSAMPTFQIFKNGVKVGSLVGADKHRLRSLVEAHSK